MVHIRARFPCVSVKHADIVTFLTAYMDDDPSGWPEAARQLGNACGPEWAQLLQKNATSQADNILTTCPTRGGVISDLVCASRNSGVVLSACSRRLGLERPSLYISAAARPTPFQSVYRLILCVLTAT